MQNIFYACWALDYNIMKYNSWNFLYIIVYLFFSYIFEVYKGNLIWKSDDVIIHLLIFHYFLDERFTCNPEFKEFLILLSCDSPLYMYLRYHCYKYRVWLYLCIMQAMLMHSLLWMNVMWVYCSSKWLFNVNILLN